MQLRRESSVHLAALISFALLCAACGPAREQISIAESEVESGVGSGAHEADGDQTSSYAPPPSLPLVSDASRSVIVGHVRGASIVAYTEPSTSATLVAELANPTPVGGPLAFQLVDRSVPTSGWVEVYLPIRPNGSTGWVAVDQLDYSANPYRIEIDRAAHELAVYRGNAEWLRTSVAIGTGGTPTPVGRFYIIELMRPPDPDSLYGPFAFGLSGFSETLTSFAGGAGVIGIHGTNDPSSIGNDVSHGCVRVPNDVIEAMAGVIPLGTPVVIV